MLGVRETLPAQRSGIGDRHGIVNDLVYAYTSLRPRRDAGMGRAVI